MHIPCAALLSCKAAILLGVLSGSTVSTYKWTSRRTKPAPFARGDVALSMDAFALGALLGSLGSIPYLVLVEKSTISGTLAAAGVSLGLLSPVYVTVAVSGFSERVARNLPNVIPGIACVTFGLYASFGIPPTLFSFAPATADFCLEAQRCVLVSGMGTMAMANIVFTNRYAIGTRHVLRQAPRTPCAECGPTSCQVPFCPPSKFLPFSCPILPPNLETVPQSVLGNLASFVLISSAMTMHGPDLTEWLPSWGLVDVFLLCSLPSQPSSLAFLQPDHDMEGSTVHWLLVASFSLFAFVMWPFDPLSWTIACFGFRPYLEDWRTLSIPFMEQDPNSPVVCSPVCRPIFNLPSAPNWTSDSKHPPAPFAQPPFTPPFPATPTTPANATTSSSRSIPPAPPSPPPVHPTTSSIPSVASTCISSDKVDGSNNHTTVSIEERRALAEAAALRRQQQLHLQTASDLQTSPNGNGSSTLGENGSPSSH